ncbi:hypothetical protein [Neogemmobacter tilapiae]|uniref:Uncharacterized protein n=1 Tax=Neogemmobacter tilapiae TaxID=875041 RepID=A0A918TE35_9RHOB|nr:hypothetical protein [Gemmobacter tilapiae]GHC43939.1 hypothetical protein GCM10007315_01310 [Gemmobacter tilapiae]
MRLDEADPKGLIRESYVIEGITEGECRSILLDWALGLPAGRDVAVALPVLLAHYAPRNVGHPMNGVMTAGLEPSAPPRRRGGRTGRMA